MLLRSSGLHGINRTLVLTLPAFPKKAQVPILCRDKRFSEYVNFTNNPKKLLDEMVSRFLVNVKLSFPRIYVHHEGKISPKTRSSTQNMNFGQFFGVRKIFELGLYSIDSQVKNQ